MAVSWKCIEDEALDIAAFGKTRIDGKVSYLATWSNGWPRIHPVTPLVGEGFCFIFVEPGSSKVKDLRDNGRYALHCGMTDSSGSSGEFKISGVAVEVSDPVMRERAQSICSFRPSARALLFELQLTGAVATSYRGGRPDRKRWSAE